jgi:hypothetical protein
VAKLRGREQLVESLLVPRTSDDEWGARESIQCTLIAIETHILLMMREREVGMVGTTDEAGMGYYMVKWISKPYCLQVDTDGMAGVIDAGVMVAHAIYYNRVERAPYWYTQSGETTVIEVRYVLLTGLKMEDISNTNPLPQACNRLEATRQKAQRVSLLDHEKIMEEAGRCDQLLSCCQLMIDGVQAMQPMVSSLTAC